MDGPKRNSSSDGDRQVARLKHPHKLGLRDRTQLVVFAYERGLVEAGTRDIGH